MTGKQITDHMFPFTHLSLRTGARYESSLIKTRIKQDIVIQPIDNNLYKKDELIYILDHKDELLSHVN